ncbi:MAG: LPS export ABC transporter ATP-binding protein, partial [Rhizobiales bacterium]|nr:LPS export ABC transporter ATP-binding protein [Hyphomicrobiales bacterium]
GRILLDGDDITRMPLYERARRGMSYLPQEPSAFRSLSVEDNVLMVLEGHVADAARRKRLLGALLREFGLEDIRRVRASRLSGGQRRRCEIARALASNPSYILLDEPFAGIDPLAASEIQILVRNFTRLGFGVLITDHNVRETLSLVDRAYVIDQGRVLMKGTPDAVVAHPGVRSVYLGESFRL